MTRTRREEPEKAHAHIIPPVIIDPSIMFCITGRVSGPQATLNYMINSEGVTKTLASPTPTNLISPSP
jgi:hypothetical protein